MLCAATPDFSVRYILFLNVPVKFLEWSDGIGFTSWLTFRLSLDFIIWDFSSGLAVSIYGFIPPPISPSLASSCFPVTCTDLTWAKRLFHSWVIAAFILGVQARCDPFQLQMIAPLSPTPHKGCASGCASVCTRSCSLSLPFLSLCLKAEKHHFSCCLPLGFRQYST